MKSLKTLSFAAIAAATIGTASAAPTELHICGSTAYRAAVTAAIIHQLGAGYTVAYAGATSATAVYGASTAIFKDAAASANPTTGVIIKTNWTGSLAGVVDLSTRNNLAWAVDTTTTTAGPTGSTLPAGFATESVPAEVAMSDSYAGSIATIIASSTLTAPIAGTTNPTLLASKITSAGLVEGSSVTSGGPVGIVPFEYVAGNQTGTTAGITPVKAPPFSDINSFVVSNLVAGPTPVAIFPGNTDATGTEDFVYLIGRNEDSGTRIDSFAVAGVGLTPAVAQEQPTFSSNQSTDVQQTGGLGSTVTGGDLFVATNLNTEPNITWNTPGHSGYISGSDVGAVLSSFNPVTGVIPNNAPGEASNGTYFVGYVGLSDATKVTYGKVLTYNGVAASANTIQNGTYPVWSLEHLYYLGGSNANKLTGAQLTAAQSLATNIFSTYACTNSSGTTAANHTAAAQNAVNNGTLFNGAGIFYNDNVALYGNTTDGSPYILNY